MSKHIHCVFFSLLMLVPLHAQTLEESFRSPPDSAKPYTWWHWMNGHVSKEGITKDLEAMKTMGIGGFHQFSVGAGLTPGKIHYNSDEFHEMMQHALAESNRLGLDAGFNNCSGWSSSGGPWIPVEYSMKQLVWSEVQVHGGERSPIILPIPKQPVWPKKRKGRGRRRKMETPAGPPSFFRDVAVVAFPTPANAGYRLDNWEDKSLHNIRVDPSNFVFKPLDAPADAVIPADKVMVLTDRLRSGGKLDWTPPHGDWTVIRFGYTTTGARNKPPSIGGEGYEVDKLSRKAVDLHWNSFISKVIADAGGRRALTTLLIDSYEVGMHNWTDGFEQEFQKRRGYNLIPMLICMTGRIVDSADITERVLWDVRRTVAELMQENYFGYLAEKCHASGLKLAVEPYGNGPIDAPAVAMIADIPMTEFWQKERGNPWQWTAQVVPSAARLSGKSIVGAEAFTAKEGNWTACPYNLKRWGDQAFADGVNRFYFHTFAHQPWNDTVKPGMTMSRFGGNFHRNNTWFFKARAWIEYIARCQFIMQKGTWQADVLVLYGDERGFNNFLGPREPPDMEEIPGHRFDLGGMDTLNKLSVDANGDLRVSCNGKLLDMRYKLLLLKRSALMLPENAAKLCKLADQGAKIFAEKPQHSPSFSRYGAADRILKKLVAQYWDSGRIQSPVDFEKAVAALQPDCEVSGPILFNHYRIGESDFYFICNREGMQQEITPIFRISGRQPELWNPVSGKITDAPNWKVLADGRTEVSLNLSPFDSLFVVFRHPTASKGKTTDKPVFKELMTLNREWSVVFDPDWGPLPQRFPRLVPWNECAHEKIKYYSGTATYKKTFKLTDLNRSLMLDLGQVEVIARVILNGKDLGTLWKPPFRIEIGNAVKAGENTLEVEVTNLWVNRLIGDARFGRCSPPFPEWLTSGHVPPADARRKTFVAWPHYNKDSMLVPSGLLGPVRILEIQ